VKTLSTPQGSPATIMHASRHQQHIYRWCISHLGQELTTAELRLTITRCTSASALYHIKLVWHHMRTLSKTDRVRNSMVCTHHCGVHAGPCVVRAGHNLRSKTRHSTVSQLYHHTRLCMTHHAMWAAARGGGHVVSWRSSCTACSCLTEWSWLAVHAAAAGLQFMLLQLACALLHAAKPNVHTFNSCTLQAR
jgi:hypothetical protein